jgi:hypothetical protein
MRIPAIAIGVMLCLPSLEARAAKVAIAAVRYVQVQSGEAAEAARQIEDKVADGAREAGYEVLRGAAVADAVRESAACAGAAMDRACLEAVAEALGVDEAIAVSVTDDDHTSYRVEVIHARRDKVVDERTAGFFVVLEWVRGTVALTLQKPATPASAPAPEPAKSDASDLSDASDTPPAPAAPAAPAPKPKPLHRALFWTGVGVTGALIVAYAATDIGTFVKYGDLKETPPPDRSQADWDAAHRLQVADRVLLGFSIAAAAATTVMYFFTDFEDPSQPSPAGGGLGWAPVILPNGGGLALEGRF